jgi:hypothetical protein
MLTCFQILQNLNDTIIKIFTKQKCDDNAEKVDLNMAPAHSFNCNVRCDN